MDKMIEANFFLESIKYHQGKLWNLNFHQERVDYTRERFFPGAQRLLLEKEIQLPFVSKDQMYKCRLVYGLEIEKIELILYQQKAIKTLKIVDAPEIDYSYKYLNRRFLQHLWLQKAEADDILIVKKDRITDTSYANVAFFDGQDWYTPTFPLLKGIQRAFLLAQKIISEKDILLKNLSQFQSLRLFNAMLDWEAAPEIRIESLLY